MFPVQKMYIYAVCTPLICEIEQRTLTLMTCKSKNSFEENEIDSFKFHHL
jgi:hypothetical protein